MHAETPGEAATAGEAACAVARAHGLHCGEPVILREAWHVLVHLQPLAIVARVSSSIPFPAGPRPDDIVRELAVARHAALAGAPVVPPADALDPGPHRHGGRVITFWTYAPSRGPVDARVAGRGLRTIHEALADFDHASLPPAGHGEDVAAMLATLPESDDVELLRELAARGPADRGQALHGDAHLDNCLHSAGGMLWHDFESTCRGSREYDLAALVLRDRSRGGDAPAREALLAYGEHDSALLDELLPVYAAWVYASFLVALPRRPELAQIVSERLRWLRAYLVP